MALHRLFLFSFLLLLFSLGSPPPAQAAYLTDIADSFDYENKNPFDFRLEISYQFLNIQANIARENGKNINQLFTYPSEFRLVRTQHAMIVSPSIGLYKDLELKFWLPIIFSETYEGQVTQQAQAAGSSLLNDKIVSAPNFQSKHGPGIGDMSIGINWGISNEQRDVTPDTPLWSRATWVLGMRWTFPSGEVWNPRDPRLQSGGGGVGRGAHVLSWHLSFSKRVIRHIDPYVRIWYNLYLVTQNVKEKLQQGLNSQPRVIENALAPSHQGGLLLGSEFVIWDSPEKQQKFAFDLRFGATGQFEGRDYTMITDGIANYQPKDASGKLLRPSLITDHEQYFSFGLHAALYFRVAKYGYFRLEGSLYHTLPYFLTYAKRGVDNNGNGFVDPGTDEEYPYHVRLLDGIGKRIQQRDTLAWTLHFSAGLTL